MKMKRSIGILLGLAFFAGAALSYARGGGGHGGGGHSGGGMAGHSGMGGRSAMGSGQRFTTGPMHFTAGSPQFTTGSTRFTTGTMRFTGARPINGRPVVGTRPAPVIVAKPGFPHRHHVVGGTVVVGGFWYPYYPYPYPYAYPYAYPSGYDDGSAYAPAPTYIEQGTEVRYYCPDLQDYYPNVPNCPSPWMQVIPDAAPATN